MSIAVITLFILSVLPITLGWVSGSFRHKQLGVVDNKEPRIQNQQLTGAGARAVAAQNNAWEALAVVTAAVVALSLSNVDIAAYAMYFYALIILRVLHAVFYISNQDILRSLAFVGGFGICIYFFILAL